MKTIYRTQQQKINNKLHRMKCDDRAEYAKSSVDNIKKNLRIQLVRDYPMASPEEIEDKIRVRFERGMRPTGPKNKP